MPTDLANIAAAQSAGYGVVSTDRGASFIPASLRWQCLIDKMGAGAPSVGNVQGGGPARMLAIGEGSSQANAEAAALSNLNKQRQHRYVGSPGRTPAAETNTTGSNPGSGAQVTDVS